MESHSKLEAIKERLREYTKEREWEQFHSPKNLSMALSVESSELLEIFQWKTEEASFKLSEQELENTADELADIFVYCLMISDKLGVDLLTATEAKITKNEQKYPAEKVRGSAKKYTEY